LGNYCWFKRHPEANAQLATGTFSKIIEIENKIAPIAQ